MNIEEHIKQQALLKLKSDMARDITPFVLSMPVWLVNDLIANLDKNHLLGSAINFINQKKVIDFHLERYVEIEAKRFCDAVYKIMPNGDNQ